MPRSTFNWKTRSASLIQVRRNLRPGMKISYFDEVQNRLIKATVRELHRTRLFVENWHVFTAYSA